MSNSYFISIAIHLGLFLAAMLVTPPVLDQLANQPITIEIMEPVETKPVPPVAAQKRDQKAQLEQPQAIHAKASSTEEALIAKKVEAPMKKSSLKKSSQKKVNSAVTKLKSAKASPRIVHSTGTSGRAGVPETLDDIESSDLDYDSVAVNQTGSLNESDLDSEFSKVDQKSEAALKEQRSAFDNELKNIADESENELSGIEKENKENAKVMSEALNATRTKNAAMLAKIRAGELAAAKAAAAQASSRQGGNGNNTFGAKEGVVRPIENLRQLAGNPKPQYSMEERFNKQQGTVVFQAFVTPEGTLQNFKLVQSTGHKNLDGKTLAALKKWRFYPGQQGWVEIPQTWNLKGEAEEMPTTLRRKITQR